LATLSALLSVKAMVSPMALLSGLQLLLLLLSDSQ
jgi:hypothetical protein